MAAQKEYQSGHCSGTGLVRKKVVLKVLPLVRQRAERKGGRMDVKSAALTVQMKAVSWVMMTVMKMVGQMAWKME
jgi:hypothetical protein